MAERGLGGWWVGLVGALSGIYTVGARHFIFKRIRSRMITDITTSQALVRDGKVLPVAQIIRRFFLTISTLGKPPGSRMSEITTLRTISKKSVPHYQSYGAIFRCIPIVFYAGYAIIVFHTTTSLSAICERRRRENQWVDWSVT